MAAELGAEVCGGAETTGGGNTIQAEFASFY
jgi:hypothetical protein